MRFKSIVSRCRIFLARLSIWRGIAWLLRLSLLVLVVFGFFYLLNISDESICSCCEVVVEVSRCVGRVFSWPSRMTGAQALAGILILFPICVLIVVQFWHCVFHRRKTEISGAFNYAGQQSQNAIRTEDEDELGRGPFVRHLMSILSGDIAENHALYIGLHGEWGEGIRKDLRTGCKVVMKLQSSSDFRWSLQIRNKQEISRVEVENV